MIRRLNGGIDGLGEGVEQVAVLAAGFDFHQHSVRRSRPSPASPRQRALRPRRGVFPGQRLHQKGFFILLMIPPTSLLIGMYLTS